MLSLYRPSMRGQLARAALGPAAIGENAEKSADTGPPCRSTRVSSAKT